MTQTRRRMATMVRSEEALINEQPRTTASTMTQMATLEFLFEAWLLRHRRRRIV